MKFIVWMILGVLFFILELVTPGIFFFTSLSIGFFMAGLSTFFIRDIFVQWLIFLFFSVLSIFLIKLIMRKNGKPPVRLANTDALKGKTGIVLLDIVPSLNQGLVRVEGEEWKAVSDVEIKKGETVRVLDIEGVHLTVKKA